MNRINIVGDDNFKNLKNQYGWKGDGTKGSPIIIENILFENYNLTEDYKIFSVENTKLYFIFRQNEILMSSEFNSLRHFGIYLKDSENGMIVDNNLSSKDFKAYAIYIENSKNIHIINNIVNGYIYGLFIQNSNVKIENNFLINVLSGTVITNMLFNNFEINLNNNLYFGNAIGIEIIGSETRIPKGILELFGNIFSNNIQGLSIIGFSMNINDNYFFNNTNEALFIRRSLNSNISNNMFDNNKFGIKISTPTAQFNPSLCIIDSSIPECNEVGNNIQLHHSNISIIENVFQNQTDSGIYIEENCDWNKIVGNNFLNNFNQAHQISTNFWFDNNSGNYWSDYKGVDSDNNGIGDTPYIIEQSGNDNRPLVDIQEIKINNTAFGLVKYVQRDIVDSFILYSFISLPVLAIVSGIVIFYFFTRYKKYKIQTGKKEVTFKKYITKQMKDLKPKKIDPTKPHADRALEILEEILNENTTN
jgi:parallel beta-helix repeat protein